MEENKEIIYEKVEETKDSEEVKTNKLKKVLKKWYIWVIFILSVSLIVIAFNTLKKQQNKTQYADEAFLESFAKGLDARWTKCEDEDDIASMTADKYQKTLESLVNVELKEIEIYQNKKFKDSKLQEKAIAYINALKQQKEGIKYYGVDDAKYADKYTEAYDQRSVLIKDIANHYELKISKENKQTLEDMKTNASVVEEKSGMKSKIDAMVDKINFAYVEQPYDDMYKKYEAVLTNETGKDLKSFSLSINLLDEQGVVVGTEYDTVSNWKAGSAAKFEFSTSESFAKTQITADWNN